MTEMSLPLGTISQSEKHFENAWRRRKTWWNFTAFLFLAGGVLFGIIGLLMSGIGYLIGTDTVDSKIGTVLVALSFPLMMFGAHALDKAAEEGKRAKGN